MVKLTVLFAVFVYSWAANASPSVTSAQHATGCTRGHNCEDGAGSTTALCEDQVARAVAPLQQTIIQLQAQSIQGLVQLTKSTTATSPPLCATEDAAITMLQKTVSELTLTIQRQNNTNQELVSTIQRQNNTNQELVSTIQRQNNTNQELVSTIQRQNNTNQELVSTIQRQNNTNQELVSTIQRQNNTNQELVSTIQRQNHTNQELMNAIQNLTTTIARPTPAPAGCGHDSGYTYRHETGSCYKLHTYADEGVSWPEARDVCVAEGGHLAVINGRGEAVILRDMAALAAVQKNFNAFMGYQLDDNGVWRAVTGEELQALAGYNPWRTKWPRIDERRRYAVMVSNGTLVNVFKDLECYLFICEKRPQ